MAHDPLPRPAATPLWRPQPARAGTLSLRAGALWALGGSAASAGGQWLFIVLLAKLTRPEEVGHYALALALTAPAVMLLNLQLRALIASDATGAFRFADYLSLRLFTTLLGLAGSLVVAGLLGYRGAVFALIAAVALGKALDAVADVLAGAQQQHERLDRVSTSALLKALLGLLGAAAVLRGGGGAAAAGAAMAGLNALVLLLYDLPMAARVLEGAGALRPRLRWGVLRQLAVLALPLGVVMLLVSLIANVPRYFIEHRWGATELGVYSALAYVLTAGMLAVSAAGQAATPRLARAYAQGRRDLFVPLCGWLMAVALAMGVGGVAAAALFGRELLTLLYTPTYAARQHTFVLVMVGAAVSFLAGALGSIVTAARVLRAQVPLCLAVLAVTTLASAAWVPGRGADGAALATLCGFLVQLGGFALLYRRALAGLARSSRGTTEEGGPGAGGFPPRRRTPPRGLA
ncbi:MULTISPECIES: lipopolysaccharide biosynthesis protein [Myxococcaceae]|uniref:lipopolysaccharide biosynthesis protein n=1 Tax=Myxococcaceae TaxID=31 RepID=UPI00188FAD76|nr:MULTISPECIES: lipopolysaccharide biosynthesis protein [Myxococcaceae]MBF5043462.1 lipopolysaccharide biosynthesis protein [Simulacricoccus sp. 17bor-14]